MKLLRFFVGSILVFCLLAGVVCADIRPPNTPQTQSILSMTSVNCNGTFTETDSLVWRQSNEALDANIEHVINFPVEVEPGSGDWIYNEQQEEFIYVGPGRGNYILPYPEYPPLADVTLQEPEPPLALDEVQITNSISETTLAHHGRTAYMKRSSLDTDWKTANMYNVEQEKMVGFFGFGTGRITSEESAVIDSVGMTISIQEKDLWLCPFHGYERGCLPPFCNIVEMGSYLDMTEVQFNTGIKSRIIADAADNREEGGDIWKTMPVIDGPPTQLQYKINVNGITPASPAQGSVAAYINVHAMEGSDLCPTCYGGTRLDLLYKEKTTAQGAVPIFQKYMDYESGIRCAGCAS